MSWTKVEDLAFATMIATTAPKYLSTWKPTDPFASQVNMGRIIIYAALHDSFFSYVLLYRMGSMVWADSGTPYHHQRARRRNFLGLGLLP